MQIFPITFRILLIAIIWNVGCGSGSQPQSKEVIEKQAFEAIDFEGLEPSIREFIELAKEDEVIGRPISEFGDILSFEIKGIKSDEEIDKQTVSYLALAMTKQAIRENKEVPPEGGTLHFPFLELTVDDSTRTITQFRIFTLGLATSRVDKPSKNIGKDWF